MKNITKVAIGLGVLVGGQLIAAGVYHIKEDIKAKKKEKQYYEDLAEQQRKEMDMVNNMAENMNEYLHSK